MTTNTNITLTLVNNNIVLFDGVCNLCNSTIDLLLKLDKKKVFYFCSLQSTRGEELIKKLNYQSEPLSSIIFVKNFKIYDRSSAILKILQTLGFPWNLFSIFFLVPKPIRDFFYRLVSTNRYRLFGKKDTCRLPTEEEKSRFIS